MTAVCLCWPQLVAYKWSEKVQAGPAKSAAYAEFALAVLEHSLHWCMQHMMLTKCIGVVAGPHHMYVRYVSRLP